MNWTASTKSPTTSAFCPACWRLFSASDTACRECGAEIAAVSWRPYSRKLLAALDHPIGEVRLRAAALLGDVGERQTYEPLVRIASESHDPYLAATALQSLARLLERFPDLPAVDWAQFTRPDQPITVRVAAVEICKREVANGRRARQEARG